MALSNPHASISGLKGRGPGLLGLWPNGKIQPIIVILSDFKMLLGY